MEDGKIYGSENRRKMYENLSNDGFELGTFEDFNQNMDNKDTRQAIYRAAQGAGWELPEYDQFDRDMTVRRMKIGGEMKEVDHSTYDDFMKRHPSGTNVKKGFVGQTPQQAPQQPQQQPKPVAVSSAPKTVEAPESQTVGTPWGSEGSATGKSAAYKPSAPGQVRETGDPGASQFGVPYKPDTEMNAAERDAVYRQNDFAVKQLRQMEREEERRSQPVTDTGNKDVNSHIIKTQGEWEDDLQKGVERISSSVVVPAVDKAVAEFDKKASEVFEGGRKDSNATGGLPTGTAAGAGIFGNIRESNQAKDPDKILNYLKQQMESVYKDGSFVEKIGKEADRMGIDRNEYLEKIIKPQIQSDLASRFESSMISKELPKSGLEYVVNGLSNSIVGMVADTFLKTKSQRAYKNQAEAMTEEGRNPNYSPSTSASLSKIGVTFAADAPFFGVTGRVGGQVAKKFAERQIQNMMAKGLSEGAARSIVGTALENSVGARMKNYIMQHVISSGITMGGFNALSEGARQVRDDEFDPLKLAGSTAEGLATGAAFGLTGGVSQALSQPLSGFAKIGAKAAGFGAEAETMYATEELAKMIQGEEGFTNPFEGSVESLMKLGVMKLSSPGGLVKTIGEIAHPLRSNQAQRTGVNFTKEEEALIRDSAEGKSLLEALSGMHPDKAVSEVNGKKKLTPEGEEMRRNLADSYNAFMENPEYPATVKEKVAAVLGGVYKPGLETGADIVQGDDGSVTLKTRDKDGNCIREMKFDSFEDADKWRNEFKSQMERNDAVNMWNNASDETRQKIVDAVRDQISGEKEAAEMLERANGMRQSRMQRELEKLNKFKEEHEGRELTDEEAREYIQMVIRDGSDEVFREMYQTIHDNANPKDEYNPKRNYEDGRKVDSMERHFAQADVQIQEERLAMLGQDFAKEVTGAAGYADEKMAELAMRKDVTKEQLEAARDYYNATAKLAGVMEEALKEIDEQVEAANAQIRRNTHPDSGALIEASYDNKDYYVTAGHIQIMPDGKIVSSDGSGVVILRDRNTGEIEVMNPQNLTVTAILDPKRLIDANESMEGLRGQLVKQADDSIELHPDTPETPQEMGETFTGSDGKLYMVAGEPDGTGNVVWLKIGLNEEGNPVGEPQPLDIDEYRKAKSDEIDAADMPSTEETPIDTVLRVPEVEQPASDGQAENMRREDEGEGTRVEAVPSPERPEHPQSTSSSIPVDESGKKLYEQAKPEDTLSDLIEKRGEDKAEKMVGQMVDNISRQISELSKKDMSKVTDMNDIDAYETEISDLHKKLDYWKGISDKIKTEKAKKSWNNLVNPKEIRNFATDPEGQQRWVDEHIDEIVDSYIRTHGNLLDPDEIRNAFAGIGYNGKNVTEYREQEGRVVAAIYERMLSEAVANGNTSITLLTGAGKSTATRQMDLSGRGVVYDSAFNKFKKLNEAIEAAKAAGMKDIQVIAVYNDATTSFSNSVERGLRTGRFMSLDYFVNGAFLENSGKISQLRQAYPDVEIIAFDNSGNKASERPDGGRVTPEEAEGWDYTLNDSKLNELLDIFENGINEGRFTEDQIASIGRGLRNVTRRIPDLRVETEQRVSRIAQGIFPQDVPDLRPGVPRGTGGSGRGGLVPAADGAVQGSSGGRPAEGEQGAPGHGTEPAAPADGPSGAGGEGQPVIDQKQKKKLFKTAEANTGKTFTFTSSSGVRSELTLQRIDHNGDAVVTRQDYDAQGNPVGEAREERYAAVKVGEAIDNGTWKKNLNSEEHLREVMRNKPGAANVISVFSDGEIDRLWKTYESGDKEAFENLYDEYRKDHFEDLIALSQRERVSSAERTLGYGTREEKIRRLRKIYQGNDDAVLALSDESMEPQSVEEYITSFLGDVPKPGEGSIAWDSYGEGDARVIGLRDETGFGSRGFGGDTKGFNPWLAAKGQGVSLAKFSESLHEQLPEGLKEQYTDQDIRNILLDILTNAEKPTDIPNSILYNRMRLAEEAMRREEQEWIDSGMRYQKVSPDEKSFAGRLERAKQQTNTEPTEAQKEAGNYKKGHVSFGGYDFVVENPEGSMRRGKDADGKAWEQKMHNTYGYILGKRGKDGDHLDMFINDAQDLDNWNGTVYVVDQVDPKTGKLDEHKILFGFDSEAEARDAYLSNYEDGWQGLGRITGVDKDTFDKWLDSSDRKIKEFSEHSIIKNALQRAESEAKEPESKVATPSEQDRAIRDAVVEHLRSRGIEVSDDWQLGQKILDDYNSRFSVGEDTEGDIKAQKSDQPNFFRTANGQAYGYTYQGKIYIDPRIATSETPVHEYGHLWAEMKRQTAPEEWGNIKQVMLTDKLVQPIIDKVKADYPELAKEGREDDFVEEIITQFSGKRGSERLREIADEIAAENGGVFGKAEAVTAMQRLKNILNRFWEGIAKMMGWKYTNANQIADRIMADMLNDVNPRERMKGADNTVKGQQERRTLMGVHNISEEKLKKAIKQGGLANPSLAVVNTDIGIHTDYGEISLIPRSTLIDAMTGRNAGTYAGDAWSPTYPSVSRVLTKQGDKHRMAIAKEFSGGDSETERHLGGVIYDYIEGNGDRLHWLFLKQKGLDPEIKPERTSHTHEEFEEIQKIFGEGTVTLPSHGRTKEQDNALLDLMTRDYERDLRENAKHIKDEAKREAYIKIALERKLNSLVDKDGNLYFAPADTYVYENWRDEKKRKEPKPDWYMTDNEANYRVAKEGLAEEYEQWKEQLFDDGDIKEQLFAGWTPDGNKRYVANTVQNASRLMNKESDTNAYDQNGLNATRSSLLKRMKSLSDIRKAKHLLQGKEAYDSTQKEMSDELFDIISQISDMQKISDNRYMNIDYAEARLQEAIAKRDPIGHLNKEYGYDIARDSELASQIMNFIEKAGSLPVKYFETKFKRPVGLEEFAVAVVPEKTSPEVIEALKKAGLDVRTYDNTGTEEQKNANRTAATMDAVTGRDDIRFQKKTDRYQLSETEKDAEGNSFYEKDGSVDLWTLPNLFARARRQAAPIRLTGRNMKHILNEHRKEIGSEKDVLAFLDDIFSNAPVLRRARGRGMFVVVEQDNTDRAAIIKLMPSKTGDYYNVETAGYYRKNKWKDYEDVIADLREPDQSDAAADASKPQTPDENGGEPINAEAQTSSSEGKDTKKINTNQENSQENASGGPKFQRTGSPEPEMTPEERQYWNKWDKDMRKWKERNALPAEATGPGEKPKFRQGESALDFAKRLVAHNREKALWQTAPKLEDYHQKREDKDILEAARENERRYPDSPSARMRRIAAEFQQIRHAMSQQKAYDKATVKAVTDFAQDFMRQGFGDNLGRGEMERMLSSVKNATGAKDIRQSVDNIMNILIDNHLRNLDQQVQKLSSTKELSKTAQGVEKQGKLELKGQRMIQAFRKAREGRMDADKLREEISKVAEKMARNDEEAPMWEQEFEGLQIALQYQENIEASRDEYADLDREYKEAVSDYKTSGRSYKDQQQLLESLDQAMMENKIERIGMFGDIIGRLQGNISESMQGAKEFVEREKERVKHIQQIANFDLAGKPADALREKTKGKPANFFLQPLGTFEQMLRQFGSRNANGEGYLYDYFMRNWMDATDKAFLNEQKAKEELDAKAREVFGSKVKRWSDLYDIARSLPTLEVEVLDGENSRTFTMNQGNLLYIYMADKMTDGRMKLRKIGIDEETVDKIKDFLDPRLVQLGDWLQDEYLVKKRIEYNKVHERMFGAPMAAIDHYFPLKVLGDARYQEQDVNVPDSETLPSTITGNIIKRRKNALPLDILHTDALSLAIEHVEDMEHWAAQSEWNKDINTLLSYTTFRNKVKNMDTVYGSGDALWNAFKDTAKMAAGTYDSSAKSGHVDKAISNIAKGVTAAKINFRAYTAFKQILSAPAFLHDVRLDDFVKNSVNPYGSWKWAMENMPVFQKRWKSRQAGDTRLMDDPTDWKMWKTNVVQMATRLGMSPNALVDGITCAVGARSIYESRYRKYKKIGASDEVARKRALQDAEIGYNLTQQSSEGAFTSAIQKDRTVAANMLSVFRNSSMSYTRQWYDAYRNLKKRTQKGYKEDSIKFMTRQIQEQFGLDDDQAKKAAEMEYAREGRRDVARMLNMMFGVTVAWNLGASLPYLLLGDDGNTKKEMMTDALLKGLIAGPTEGFAAGNIWSDLIGRTLASEETRRAVRNEGWGAGIDAALKQGGDYEVNPLPLMADIQSMINKMGYDKFAAAQDVFNICIQSAVGVNPQTFTDMWNAVMDYGNPSWMPFTDTAKGNDDLSNSKEIALFIMRVLNAPTSSWRNKYIDELGMSAEDAKKLPYGEMAKRYANYKHWKDAPIMGWLRGEEGRVAKIEKIQKQFDKAVEERMQRLTDQELMHNVARSESPEEKRKYAKLIAQRLGLTPGQDSKKPKDDEVYQKIYQQRMLYEDIVEDETLAAKYKDIEKAYKEKYEEASRKSAIDEQEFVKANKDWKKRIDDAKGEVKKRLDWIRDGKYDSENGRPGKHKNPENNPKLLYEGKKQLETTDDKETYEDIMNNIRKWRKEALELLLRAEAESK